MLYRVNYINEKGELSAKRVEADSPESARFASNIPDKRIESIRQDYLAMLLKIVEKPRPARKNQAVFLQLLSSSLVAGKTLKSSINKLVAEAKWLKVKAEQLDACTTLAQYIRLLRFDNSVLLLAETADRTGQTTATLRKASQYLLSQERIKSEVAGTMKTGITYIILGSIFFFCVPAFIASTLQEIESTGLSLRRNGFTVFLEVWGALVANYYWVGFIVAALIAIYVKPIWFILKYQVFFSAFNDKILLSRGIEFTNMYKMMHAAGYTDAETLKAALSAAKGTTRTILQRMLNHVLASKDISTAFEKEHWPSIVMDGFSVFNAIDNTEKHKILESLIETCTLSNIETSRQISANLSRLGMLFMIGTVLSAGIGFYLPIASAASGGGSF